MSSKHWSNYWEGGQLTSLPQDFKENYNDAIQQQWINCFNELAPNSSILDLCAGNCAIGLLAASYTNSKGIGFNITAIDAANISKKNILAKYPNQKNNLAKINLISNCKIEDINLESSQYDLISSQYGIEYCDWEQAAQQVKRLLKPDGKLVIISHSGSTEIIKYMQQEKEDYQFLFKIEIFKTLLGFCNNKISYRKLVLSFNSSQQLIKDRFLIQATPLLNSINSLIYNIREMNKTTLLGHKDELKKFCLQHKYAFDRLCDLFRVTQAITNNPSWYKIFINQGLQLVDQKPIIDSMINNTGHLYCFENN